MNQTDIRDVVCIDGKIHQIENSWGSLWKYKYCAVCSKCQRTFTPSDIAYLMRNNYSIVGNLSGDSLIRLMKEHFSYMLDTEQTDNGEE